MVPKLSHKEKTEFPEPNISMVPEGSLGHYDRVS